MWGCTPRCCQRGPRPLTPCPHQGFPQRPTAAATAVLPQGPPALGGELLWEQEAYFRRVASGFSSKMLAVLHLSLRHCNFYPQEDSGERRQCFSVPQAGSWGSHSWHKWLGKLVNKQTSWHFWVSCQDSLSKHFESVFHRNIESLRLDKTSKIIKSNRPPNTTMPAKPHPKVSNLHVFWTPVSETFPRRLTSFC